MSLTKLPETCTADFIGNCSNCNAFAFLVPEYKDNQWDTYVCLHGCANKNEETKTKIDYCEDCGRYNQLERAPACADYATFGTMCCVKLVCIDGCDYQCANSHWNKIYADDGWYDDDIPCECCGQDLQLQPSDDYDGYPWQRFSWWGMSPTEWDRRYG
jgi:hypothetical protein